MDFFRSNFAGSDIMINSFKNNKIIKTKSNKIKIKNVNTLNLFFRQQIKRK